MKRLFVLAALTSAATAFAAAPTLTKHSWQAVGGNYNGDFSDPGHWDVGLPGAKSLALFAQSKNYTVTLTNDLDTLATFRFQAYSGCDNVLDWRNVTWRQIASETDNYGDNPFALMYSTADSARLFVFANSTAVTDSSWRYKKMQSCISNAYVRMSVRGGGLEYNLDFDSGTFNFHDPDGTPWNNPNSAFVLIAEPKSRHEKLRFHEGTRLILPAMKIHGNALTNLVEFDGGAHEIHGSLMMPSDNFNTTVLESLTTLRVADTALVALSGGIKFGGTSGNYTTAQRTARVLVENGGELSVSGGISHGGPGTYPIDVGSNGTLTVSGSTLFYLGRANGNTNVLTVAKDGTLKLKDGATVYAGSNGYTANLGCLQVEDGAAVTLEAGTKLQGYRNGTVRLGAVSLSGSGQIESSGDASATQVWKGEAALVGTSWPTVGRVWANSGLVALTNVAFAGGEVCVSNRHSRLMARGGLFDGTGLQVANGGSAEVDGGVWTNAVIGLGCQSLASDLTFAGGASVDAMSLALGQSKDCVATLTIAGEGTEVATRGDLNVSFLDRASVTVNVTGGKLTVPDGYNLSLAPAWPSTATLSISGGEVSVATNTTGKYLRVGTKGKGTVNVSGGILSANCIILGPDNGNLDDVCELYQTGGEIDVTAKNTSNYGLFVAHNKSTTYPRKGRLVLDGGVLRANLVNGGWSSQCRDYGGHSSLQANGGRIVATEGNSYFLRYFDEATLGAKGLTVESDYDVTIDQSFADQNGASGVLTLTGAGTKKLSGTASSESLLVAAGGTVEFTASARHASALVVTNGAAVTLPAEVAAVGMLKGLSLGDAAGFGQLNLVSGTELVVDGDTEIALAKIAYTGELARGTKNTIRVRGTVSNASRNAWTSNTMLVSLLAEGDAASFTVRTDNSDTLLEVEIVENDNVIRVEEDTTVEKPVPYGAGATLSTIVGANATLDLNGSVGIGGLVKTGAGALNLNAANDFRGMLASHDGLFSAASLAALGFDPLGAGTFLLAGGTLALYEDSGAARFPYQLTVQTPVAADAVVLKTDSDWTMAMPTLTSGALMKRGAGDLVFEGRSGIVELTGSTGSAADANSPASPQNAELAFDDFGTVPEGYYPGFNVVEGAMVLKGAADGTTVFDAKKSGVCVGLPTLNGTVQPELVVDNATLSVDKTSRWLILGLGCRATHSFVATPTLTALNGAVVDVQKLYVGACYASRVGFAAQANFDGSTLAVRTQLSANSNASTDTDAVYRFRNGSVCELAKLQLSATAHFSVSGGSTFKCGGYDFPSGGTPRLALAFDGGEWLLGDGDATLSFATWPNLAFTLEANGEGLVLAPPESATWTLSPQVTGTGGIVKRGAGTVVLAQGEACTGTNRCESGVLAFAGTAVTGCAVAGAGTFADATVHKAVLALSVNGDLEADEIPTFADCTLGRMTVDLGRTAENPLPLVLSQPIVVAHYTGSTAPRAGDFRLKGTGRGDTMGTFEVSGGEIRLTGYAPGKPGLCIIFR